MLIFTSRFAFATLNFESVESLDKFAASFKALFVVGSSDQQTTPFPTSIHKSVIKLTGETKPLKNPYEDSFKTSTIFAKFEKLQKTKTKVEGGLQRQAGQGTSKAREPKKLKIVETPIIAELSKKYEEKGKMMKALGNEDCYFKPKDNLSNYLGASFINPSKFTSNSVPQSDFPGYADTMVYSKPYPVENVPKKKKKGNKKPKANHTSKVVISLLIQVYVAKT